MANDPTWLDEIEHEIAFLRKNGAMGRSRDFQRERMARVLREQSAVLGNGPWDFVGGDVVGGGYKCRYCQAFLKTYLSPDGIGPIDFMERHKKDCIWRNLSDDAKALLKVGGIENGR